MGSGPRLRLEHVGLERGRELLVGGSAGLTVAVGWPHADTLVGIRMGVEHASRDEETPFLAVLRDSGTVVGDGGWKGGPDASGAAEIGYGLAPSFRGRGLGTELVRALTAWALAQPRCTRVVAQVEPGNLPSRRALERAGFSLLEVGPPLLVYAIDGPWKRGVTGE